MAERKVETLVGFSGIAPVREVELVGDRLHVEFVRSLRNNDGAFALEFDLREKRADVVGYAPNSERKTIDILLAATEETLHVEPGEEPAEVALRLSLAPGVWEVQADVSRYTLRVVGVRHGSSEY